MQTSVNPVLVSIIIFSSEGHSSLKELVKQINQVMAVSNCSSIYSVKGNPSKIDHIHDLRSLNSFSGLCVVLKAESPLDPDKTLKFFNSLEEGFRNEAKRRSLSINLLLYGDIIKMTPGLTVPHPDFHSRPEFIVPGAEVWGEMTHPVLGESLNKLTNRFAKTEWGEFYAQGETVLAF